MRSQSEIRWVRAKNNVGQATKVSQWHAIVPGIGSRFLPPGTACGVGLTGSLQFESDQGVRSLDGQLHQECIAIAGAYLESIDPSPGPREPDPEPKPLAPPDTTYTEVKDRR